MSNPQPMTDDFVEHVKKALENLYDFPTLQQNPLAMTIQQASTAQTQPAAHQLRRELMEAIEELNPQQGNTNTGAARIYNLLHLHYVGGMTVQEASHELGISQRQVYRDLRRGQENISTIMWFHHQQRQQASEHETQQNPLPQLAGEVATINFGDLLQQAGRAVQKLAENHNLSIALTVPDAPVERSTNLAAAQQVLIHILSQVIQQLMPQAMHITLKNTAQIMIDMQSVQQSTLELDSVIEHLMQQLHWKLQQTIDDQHMALTLRTTTDGTRILVIDDNEGLLDLMKRYLGSVNYSVITASTGTEGLKYAQNILPDAIIMDLMMPDMDGWEALQRIRTYPETQRIPVIICSVINDPELAYSLGANKVITKPIEKEDILLTLQGLGL